MSDIKICSHCNRPLEPITFYLHDRLRHELNWLLENRRVIAKEEDIDEVLARLIQLEFDKRWRIEEGKKKNKAERESSKLK